MWRDSGLDFGTWAPFAEEWYQRRKSALESGSKTAVMAKSWRGRVKYEGQHAYFFRTRVTVFVKDFLNSHRLL